MNQIFSGCAIAGFGLGAVTGVALAEPTPQCGGVDENTQDCSREGRQAGIPGGWRFESRDEFPERRCAPGPDGGVNCTGLSVLLEWI